MKWLIIVPLLCGYCFIAYMLIRTLNRIGYHEKIAQDNMRFMNDVYLAQLRKEIYKKKGGMVKK